MCVGTEPASPDRRDLDQKKHEQGEGDRRVEVGRRRAAEGEPERLERQDAELIEQEDQQEQGDEERDERLAAFPERTRHHIRDILDDAFEHGLRAAGPRRPVTRAHVSEKREGDRHGEPCGQDRVRVNRPEEGQVPQGMRADFLFHVISFGRRALP
jgi:hypothetical protein